MSRSRNPRRWRLAVRDIAPTLCRPFSGMKIVVGEPQRDAPVRHLSVRNVPPPRFHGIA